MSHRPDFTGNPAFDIERFYQLNESEAYTLPWPAMINVVLLLEKDVLLGKQVASVSLKVCVTVPVCAVHWNITHYRPFPTAAYSVQATRCMTA